MAKTRVEDVELTAKRPCLHEQLPASLYTDPERYQLELQRVFRGHWLLAAPLGDVPEHGALAVTTGTVPLVVTREGDTLRAFHNVCSHRGSRVVADRSEGARMRCPYHGWMYGLDGTLEVVAGRRRFADFDPSTCGLQPVHAAVWGGLVWVHLGDRPEPFADWLGPWKAELERYGTDRQVVLGRRTDPLPLNWKASVDAFNETYHVDFVHHESVGRLVHSKATWFRYAGHHSRAVIPVRQRLSEAQGRRTDGDGRVRHGKDLLPEQAADHCNYTIFPTVMFNFLATWGVVLQFEPVDVGTTEVRSWMLADPPRSERHEAALGAQWREFQKVLEEDLEALVMVSDGLRSPAFTKVHLGGEEQRLVHFHQTVEASLAA